MTVVAAERNLPIQPEGEGSMRPDPADVKSPQSLSEAVARVTKSLRRKRARALASPVGRQTMTMLMANFGMIAGLLCIWAMTVNL
jgi:hypothetical protein